MLGVRKADQQDTGMSTCGETSLIRKVEILSDKKAPFALSGRPDFAVEMSAQCFLNDRMDVMPEFPQPVCG